MSDDFSLRFWGIRSGIPAPMDQVRYRSLLSQTLSRAAVLWQEEPDLSAETVLGRVKGFGSTLGGETLCAEIVHGKDRIILDLGTGVRRLGYDMMEAGPPEEIHILLTDLRWSHIQGWPFFIPAYIPSCRLIFHSCIENLEERLFEQQIDFYFPVSLKEMQSEREFHYHRPSEEFQIGNLKITGYLPSGDGTSTLYRICDANAVLVYAPVINVENNMENNITDEMPDKKADNGCPDLLRNHANIFTAADLVCIGYDGFSRKRWQSAEENLRLQILRDCLIEMGVHRCILTNFDPDADDETFLSLWTKGDAGGKGEGNTEGRVDPENAAMSGNGAGPAGPRFLMARENDHHAIV